MKIAASLLIVAALAILGAWEASWRLDHPLAGDSIVSPSDDYVAQERTLPESSVVPYGHGVFVRRAYIPFWATSRLVFAGYCKPEVRLAWSAPKQLEVGCVVAEGAVVQFPHPAGVTVLHGGGA